MRRLLSLLLCLFMATTLISCEDDEGRLDPTAPKCDGGRLDEFTGLCWQDPKASGEYSYQDAVDYCNSLTLGGHDDWSLPSAEDFALILNECELPSLEEIMENGGDSCNSCGESDVCTDLFGTEQNIYLTWMCYEVEQIPT